MATPTATEPPPAEEPKNGGVGRGLVRGALIGQIAGGDSASIARGAAIGGMRRQGQKSKEQARRERWKQEQVRTHTENRNRYNRAYAACMEAKDYTVRQPERRRSR